MKIYNTFGSQIIAYNVSELIGLETTTLRLGSNGRWYAKDIWDTNNYYELVIKTVEGTKQLGIDEENPLAAVP